MLLDPGGFHAKLNEEQFRAALQAQVEMWRFESHCWVRRQEDGVWRCSWCHQERVGNFAPSTNPLDRNMSLCPSNPVLEQFVKDQRYVGVMPDPTIDDGK